LIFIIGLIAVLLSWIRESKTDFSKKNNFFSSVPMLIE
jgi:hypothetical protein